MTRHAIVETPPISEIGYAFWDKEWKCRFVIKGGHPFHEGNQTVLVSVRKIEWVNEERTTLTFGGSIRRMTETSSEPLLMNARGELRRPDIAARESVWTGWVDIEQVPVLDEISLSGC